MRSYVTQFANWLLATIITTTITDVAVAAAAACAHMSPTLPSLHRDAGMGAVIVVIYLVTSMR